MNSIKELFGVEIENIKEIYLSDDKWWKVNELDIIGHFGNKPQYFRLETHRYELKKDPKNHYEQLKKNKVPRLIFGKISEIKLIIT